MRFLRILKKGAMFFHSKRDSLFSYNIKDQHDFIKKIPEPLDDIERSYFQYKCQMELMGNFMSILMNILLFFPSMILLIILKSDGLRAENSYVDAVFLSNDIPLDILPIELEDEFDTIKAAYSNDKLRLKREDRKFIWNIIKRYPFSWHFIFKCILKVAIYSSKISDYNPKAIITYSEYSFTSSILTKYCEENKIQHINIMHGEKLYFIRDSFFRFNRFYIWDEHYKKLFLQLKAYPEQFIISIPPSMKFDCKNLNHNEKKFDFTYYLANETKGELIKIKNALKILSNGGCNIAVRPHPRYTDYKLVLNLFAGFYIEDYKETSIKTSITRTKVVISLFSTVLNQAVNNGVDIIIDDITNPEKYSKLIDLQYLILSKDYMSLSELIFKYQHNSVERCN